MPKKELAIKHATLLTAYLLVVWGFYRFLFKFPEEIEDLIIKPILWLVPVFFLVKKEKLGLKSVGITLKNLFPSIYLVLTLGVFFAVLGFVVNFFKYGEINFAANLGQISFYNALFLSFITGFSEEITFRGYLFNRVWSILGSEWKANLLVSFVWALIHLPIAIFWWDLNLYGTLGILLITTLFGIGSSYVFARTKNVFASIFLHVLWGWPIILFR